MSLGKQLKKYRQRAGLTLDQLSELSGVQPGTLNALEVRLSGKSTYAGLIAKAFGMSIEELLDESRDHPIKLPDLYASQASVSQAHHASEIVTLFKSKEWPFTIEFERFSAIAELDKARIDGYITALVEKFEMSHKKNSAITA